MQKSQPRILCSVLWLAIVAIIVIALLVPTYRLNESFEGEFVAYGESYPATAELSVTYRRDPFFGEYKNEGKLSFITDAPDDMAQYYSDLYLIPGWLDHVLWNPRFYEISAHSWRDRSMSFVYLHGFTDSYNKTLLMYDFDGHYSFAGRTCDEVEAARIFDYLTLWFGFGEDGFTENPFSHTPLIDRETAVATRTETPPDVLLKMAARDFLADCWEYLLIGMVALVALILSHWFPQIYLSKWILDELRNGSVGAKKYLNHSRICFTAMGLAVPLFACLAYFVKFDSVWQFSSGNIFFVAMIAAIIALLVLLHRRAWIQIKEK